MERECAREGQTKIGPDSPKQLTAAGITRKKSHSRGHVVCVFFGSAYQDSRFTWMTRCDVVRSRLCDASCAPPVPVYFLVLPYAALLYICICACTCALRAWGYAFMAMTRMRFGVVRGVYDGREGAGCVVGLCFAGLGSGLGWMEVR
ncbi:hypothetical protein B0T22DRAFT_260855 [Podospora appendiculata]|uniref:Uncharacterized protein n=1 Tax=Podospora appendiculata TaxID=314037 RepID=A0AAE0X2S7_9PEZI|nr:hypothetical protein B0T22DRAFT_260855 [Podospora appendiculata]